MAVELARYLAEQLARLPDNHPDRRLLTGLAEVVSAYASQVPDARIVLTPGEEPGLTYQSEPANQGALEAGEKAAQRSPVGKDSQAARQGGLSGVSGAQQQETGEPTTGTTAAAPEKQRRVNLTGMVAAVPDFRTSPKGTRVGHFPLATHPTTETTTYYEVYAFNKAGKPWADRLQALGLSRGQAVEVMGYEHQVSETRRDGRPKPNHVYVAAPVKRKKPPENGGNASLLSLRRNSVKP